MNLRVSSRSNLALIPYSLENGKTYDIWSPHDAFSAEKILADMLQQHLQQEA